MIDDDFDSITHSVNCIGGSGMFFVAYSVSFDYSAFELLTIELPVNRRVSDPVFYYI